MSQITGEIYQMMNAAKTVNRFPRTVMEAVLGLNSYLQDQFGALADIYMPIDGISESKPNQEFVFRKTPNTIKAKALTLDKINGKTLAWNQLNDNISGSTVGTIVYSSEFTRVKDHKYYIGAFVKTSASGNAYLSWYGAGLTEQITLSSNYQKLSAIYNNDGDSFTTRFARIITTASQLDYDCFSVVDLTLLYGSEIDGMTDEQILAKFESEFPGYHAYNPGALISNDAAAVETVGFNVWDEEWESGNIDQYGKPVTQSGVIRSKNFIPVLPSTAYYFYKITPAVSCVQEYDANKNHIKHTTQSSAINYSFTPSGQTAYIKITVAVSSYGHDICINLSDPAKNGTYEPYRKSTMPLNLNAIKVYSHNIWDEAVSTKAIDQTTGEQTGNEGTCISSLNHIPVKPSTIYYAKSQYGSGSGNGIYIKQFDANFTPLSSGWDFQDVKNNTFTTSANARYIKFMTLASYGTTYNNDICINVSSSFNGQYEPHGILTIEGLKGAGSVYDEIVSNKLVKRVGRVDLGDLSWSYSSYNDHSRFGAALAYIKVSSGNTIQQVNTYGYINSSAPVTNNATNLALAGYSDSIYIRNDAYSNATTFTTAMSGVMLDYELATPIEYELADPLPTSMPAGTTEARISPNADGLSAPFCADMTYGMGATEYAETAGVASFALNTQYAEVAARLLAPRTIWGQVFDGSANITGAMTGVSAIDSLMHFDTSNGRIGIGTTTPSYSLDVAGTFRAAGNSLIGGTLGVTGKLTGNTAQFESVKPSPTEYDSEHSINIPLWRLEEDGEAEFGNTYIRGLLKLRTRYYDDGTFHDATMQYEYDDEDASNCFISADKSIHAPSFVQSSDERLKTDFKDIELTVEQIASAPAVEFNWVGNGQRGAGSIAQYWEAQLPYNVHDAGGTLSMEYGNIALISAIVCARKIQELEEQIKKLKAKINV